jgi:hypothetical protein
MESKMADRSAWGNASAPVVLRVRQQTGGSRPSRAKKSASPLPSLAWVPRSKRFTAFRSDHLILFASLPLVTLVIYLGWQMVTSTDAESSLRPKTLSLPTQSVPEIIADKPTSDPSTRKIEYRGESMPLVVPKTTPASTDSNEDLPILPTEESTVRPMQGHSWTTDEANVEHAVVRPDDQPLRLGRAEAIPTHVGRIRSVMPSHPSGHSQGRYEAAVNPEPAPIDESMELDSE